MQFKQSMLLMTTLSSTCTAQYDNPLIGETCPDVGCGDGLICDGESTKCMKNDEVDDNVVTEAPTDAPAEDTQEPDAMTMEPEKCTVKTDPPTDEPLEPTDGPVEPLEPTDAPRGSNDGIDIDLGNDIAIPTPDSPYRNLRSNN